MIGDWSNRNHTTVYTPPGGTQDLHLQHQLRSGLRRRIIGGIDLLNVTQKNQAWVLGVEGGSVDSYINFRASPDRFHLSGANIGGYATYLGGGLYIDGTINANLLNMQASLPGLQTTPNPWTASRPRQVLRRQGRGRLPDGPGRHAASGNRWAWCPTSTPPSPTWPSRAGRRSSSDADSFRASLGARVGATADFQYYKVKLAITGRVWDEFSNNTLSTLIVPGGAELHSTTTTSRASFGEISGQANLFTLSSGLSAFLNGGVKFKSTYTDANVTLGARYQF